MSRLAENLKNIRKKRGLSAAQTADYCDVSVDEYLKWESDEAQPTEEKLDRLTALYGVDKEKLKNGKTYNIQFENADEKKSYSVNFGTGGFNVQTDNRQQHEKDRSFSVNMTDDGVKVDFGKKEKNMEKEKRIKRGEIWSDFPYPILCAIAFFLMGFLGGLWHPSWLVFMTIPLYYGLVSAIVNRKPNHFPFPVLAAGAYLLIGFLGITWTWSLFIFATIPMYYAFTGRSKHIFAKVIYPFICVLVYIALGILIGSTTKWWAVGWIIFLTIPIVEYFERVIRQNNNKD